MRARLFLCLSVLSFSLASTLPAHAQTDAPPGPSFTLADALAALREHPLLVSAAAGIRAAEADRTFAGLWTNPMLSGSYTKGVHRSSYDESGYLTYGVTQFLELSNAPGARRRAATLLAHAARADYEALRVGLSLDVESALLALVAAREKLAIVDLARGSVEQARAVVEKRVDAGAAPRYDRARIAVTAANAAADRDALQADVQRAEAELRAAVGPGMRALSGEPRLSLEEAPSLPGPDALLDVLAKRRPDLEAARQRAASAQASISAAKRSVFSGVAVNVAGGFGAAPGQQDLGVGVSVPLPIVSRGQGLVTGTEARAEQARSYADAVLVTARARITGMHAEVLARRTALESFVSRGIASGNELLEEATAAYLAGRFSVLELADAYAVWRDARLRAIDLATAARQAEVDLGREVGVPLRLLQ